MPPELGNFGYNWWIPAIQNAQNIPEMKWDTLIIAGSYANTHTPLHRIYEDNGFTLSGHNITDLSYIKSRFDKATNESQSSFYFTWDYGGFLLNEEILTPIERANWYWSLYSLDKWVIDANITGESQGTYTVAGVIIKSLKRWYIDKYGSWNQAWWDNVIATNTRYNINDTILKEWNLEYSLNLYKAWHNHMHNLGKKSCLIGPVSIQLTDMLSYFYYVYGTTLGNYLFDNYDMIMQYQYPWLRNGTTWKHIETVRNNIKSFRTKIKNKFSWLLTQEWSDNTGVPFDETVAKEEFNIAYDEGVDIIFCSGSQYNGFTGLYPPLLVSWYNERYNCQQPQCNFSITQT